MAQINEVLEALEHSQEAARDSARQLRTILDSIQTGFLIIDADTHLITSANTVALRMIGAPEEEVIGAPCHSVICAEEGACARLPIWAGK